MTTLAVQHNTPPRRRDRLVAWVMLAGCLLLGATMVLVELARPPVTTEAEAVALETAVQTRHRQRQFAGEPWSWDRATPHRDGLPQFDAPPGRTWVYVLAMSSLDNDAPLADLVLRARLTAAAFALLAVAGAFWAGMAIGGVVTASMSALICVSMPALMWHGRFATGDPIAVGLTMFAIAAALWAIRPLRPAAALTRQGLGWTVAGLAMGAATLVGGPEALLTVFVPILAMLLLVPHRVGHVMGLVAATLITVLMVTPWAGYVHLQHPDAWRSWMSPLAPDSARTITATLDTAWRRVALVMVGVSPWLIWLTTAVVQPFSTSSEGSRNRMFIGWTWCLVVLLLLALTPGEATLRGMLPAIPAAAVMMGQLYRHGADLSAEGRHARFWRWLRWPQWGMLLALSLIVPMAGLFQDVLVERGWLPGPVFAPLHWVFWTGMSAVGVGILVICLGPIVRHYPARAVVCWALWTVVMSALVAIPATRGPNAHTPIRADARRLAAITGDRPVLYLTDLPRPSAALTLYAERVFAPVSTAQLRRHVERHRDLYLLAPWAHHPGEPWEHRMDLTPSQLALWYCPARAGEAVR